MRAPNRYQKARIKGFFIEEDADSKTPFLSFPASPNIDIILWEQYSTRGYQQPREPGLKTDFCICALSTNTFELYG